MTLLKKKIMTNQIVSWCLISVLLALSNCGDNAHTLNSDSRVLDNHQIDGLLSQNDSEISASCVKNPQTHLEIINACTTAQSYDKSPFYPELTPHGVLPLLP